MMPLTNSLLLLTVLLQACDDGDDALTRPSTDAAPQAEVSRELELGQTLLFRDLETGSVWNLVGEAISGNLAGSRLEPIPGYSAYWFAWSSFWPNTSVWGASTGDGRIGDRAFAGIDQNEYAPDVPKDSIPPLDDPYDGLGVANFVKPDEARQMSDDDIVIGVAIQNDFRAYPVRIMNWHEIVNHTVGGKRISVTYCPLTASGINFAADDVAFGNTGGLYISNMVTYDRDTESFWAQMRAGSVLGDRTGERLELLPVYQGTWRAWRSLYPATLVLSMNTGYPEKDYGSDIYIDWGYTESEDIWFPAGVTDNDRYHPKEMVLGLLGDSTARAYAHTDLREPKIVNDRFEDRDIVVVYSARARGALAFNRRVGGQTLSFLEVD